MAAKTAQVKLAMRGPLQHQEFADEIVQHGQADAGQRGDQKHDGKPRREGRDAAVIRDFERMPAFIQQADEQEQRAGGDAVIQHLVDRAIEAQLRE